MIHIFSDASCSKTNGVGCYAILYSLTDDLHINTYYNDCHKSTKMEFLTILDALEKLNNNVKNEITIYTDCDGFVKFKKTRKNNSVSENLNSKLNDYFDKNVINVVKMKGHNKKDSIITKEQEIFRIIDRITRKKLRESQ